MANTTTSLVCTRQRSALPVAVAFVRLSRVMRRFSRHGSTARKTLVFGPFALLLACVADEQLGPPGKNMTGAVTTVATANPDEDESESETGTPGDMLGCDPLADPELECGPAMRCDLTSRACVPALGTGLAGDLCTDHDQCSPALICASGRCLPLCDAMTDEGCEAEQICSAAAEPIPGLCLTECELAFDACPFPGDACKRVVGAGGQVWAACVDNPGNALLGDPCVADQECAPGYLCTDAAEHTLPCVDDASSCCAPICDTFELPCLGAEPVCYVLDIPGQEGAGYCGAD